MKPPLLLFRLYNISKDADWQKAPSAPLPEGCAAISVSGGREDTSERRRGKLSQPDERGNTGLLTPFLFAAQSGLLARITWSLLGPTGRLYLIFRTVSSERYGLDGGDLSHTDILAALRFETRESADELRWASDFLTCFSDGLGLGFWGDVNKLEKKMRTGQTFDTFRMIGATKRETMSDVLERTHLYLQARWHEDGFEWLLENADLIVRPWGWEGEDAIFLSSRMTHEQMIQAIRRDLGGELDIYEYDGDEEYREWRSWNPNSPNEGRQWP